MAKRESNLISFPMHLSREVERLFDEMIHRPWGFCRDIRGWNPSVDLYETDEAFILEADLPGVRTEDVKLEIENREIRLRGRRLLEKRHTHGTFHVMERSSGEFIRRMKLPEAFQEDAISVDFADGVLRVTLPKLKQQTGASNEHPTG